MTREGEATAVNIFPTSLPKQFIAREGEAPAEPLHRWLGRSLALPKVFSVFATQTRLRGWGRDPAELWRR